MHSYYLPTIDISVQRRYYSFFFCLKSLRKNAWYAKRSIVMWIIVIFILRALICCSLRHTTLSSTRQVVWHTCSIFRNRGFLGRSLERYFRVSHKTFTPLFFHARNQFNSVLVPILQLATVRRVSYPRRVCSVISWRNRHTRRHFICVIGYRLVVGNLPPSCYTPSSNPLAHVTAMRRHVASRLALSLYQK